MYEDIGIDKLSPMQISKLLKGGAVRIKKGSQHQMQLSKEQNKKLNRAHMKGSGITIMLDPYQQEMHQSLHGEGLKSNLKKAGKVALGLGALALGHHLGSQLSSQKQTQQIQDQRRQVAQGKGYKGIMEANPFVSEIMGQGLPRHRGRPRKAYASKKGEGFFEDLGRSIKNVGNEVIGDIKKSGRPIASHLIHKGLPIFAGSAGGVLGGLATENPLGAVAGGTAGQYIGEALGDYIGSKTGLGIMEDAVDKVRKMSGLGIVDDAINKARKIAGLGVKKPIMKRKPKKGGALLPAGY